MGLSQSKITWVTFLCGALGTTIAISGMTYISAWDWPLNIGGKPPFPFPAFVPIMFELTVLLSAFAAFFGMWILNGLPRWYHPLFTSARFRRATQDRFFIVIEAKDPKYDATRTRQFLESLGGAVVEQVNESAED